MEKETTVVLVTGGEAPLDMPAALKSLVPCRTIAADSGWDTAARLGLSVDVVVGDMDSVSDRQFPVHTEMRGYSRFKDDSDTALAMKIIHEEWQDISSWVLVGGGGGRLDHLMDLFTQFKKLSPPSLWFTAHESLILVTSHIVLDAIPSGTTVSVIPAWGDAVSRVSSTGLVWELEDYEISAVGTSLSNITRLDTLELRVVGNPVFLVMDITEGALSPQKRDDTI